MMYNFSLRYLELLKTKFAGLNLTRILDDQEFYEKQVLDSILPYEQSSFFKECLDSRGLVVDVGFGGGFPLLPLAFHCPHIQFIGLESRRKKVDAVNVLAQDLGLMNVKAYHYRLEDVQIDMPCAITFKAVGTVCDFLPMLQTRTSKVDVFFYKGPSFSEKELPEFNKTLTQSWEMRSNERLAVPGTEERRLVGFSPRNVPRGTSKVLVKLSDLL